MAIHFAERPVPVRVRRVFRSPAAVGAAVGAAVVTGGLITAGGSTQAAHGLGRLAR